jgi:hypothetical protein
MFFSLKYFTYCQNKENNEKKKKHGMRKRRKKQQIIIKKEKCFSDSCYGAE